MITIDGSYGEGGGQIIRTALALSTITGLAFEAAGIRKGREQPGLKAQHLTCIKALEQLTGARAEGAALGSESLKFYPGKKFIGKLEIDIGTAGSITLMLQSLLPACITAGRKVKLTIKGGTCGKWQMPAEYFMEVFLPPLRRYAGIKAKLVKRGYYPAGGGVVELSIAPKFTFEKRNEAPKTEITEQGIMHYIKGVSHASASLQERQVAERQARAAEISLRELGCPVSIASQYSNTLSSGSGITLWAVFSNEKDEIDFMNPRIIGADTIGDRGMPSEEVGTSAAAQLIKEIKSGAPVDSHLADNLIPFLAIFGGKIKVSEITKHTLANIYTAEQFLGKVFEVDEKNSIISVFRLALSVIR